MKRLVVCLLFAGAMSVFAAPDAVPVAPQKPVAVALPPADVDYEVRGFFGAGADLEVSLSRRGEKESRWYAVGKKIGGIVVEKADAVAGYAILSRGGMRSSARLASSTGPAPVALDDETATEPEASKPDYSDREYRKKRFREMMEKMSATQRAEFGRVMQEKFTALQKDNPDLFRDMSTPGARRRIGDFTYAITRDALEASSKFPDVDGRINPLPDDFDTLMRAEHEASMAEWEKLAAGDRKPEEKKPDADDSGGK